MDKNCFYFLHIPKTGGRFFNHNVVRTLYEHLPKHGISLIRDKYSHTGWHPEITDKTYIATLFRDTAEQMVSLYAHALTLTSRGTRRVPPLAMPISKESMFKYYEERPYYLNFQAKNLLLKSAAGLFNREPERGEVDTIYEDIVIDKGLVYERLARIDLIMRQDFMHGRDYKDIVNKITDDFNVPRAEEFFEFNNNVALYNPDSSKLYSSLTGEEKQRLKEMSPLDTEIFENLSLYWRQQ